MKKEKAVALVTVLITIIILTIIAGISLTLMTSQARLTENQVRRIKAFYTAEGLMWRYFCGLATGARQDADINNLRDRSLNGLRGIVNYHTADDTFRVSVNY